MCNDLIGSHTHFHKKGDHMLYQNSFRQKALWIFGILIVLLAETIAFVVAQSLQIPFGNHIFVTWIVYAYLAVQVTFFEKRAQEVVGRWIPNLSDLSGAFLVFILGIAIFPLSGWILETLGVQTTVQGIGRLEALSTTQLVGMAITAGVTEELGFRAYAITTLKRLTKRPWLPYVLPLALFSLLHLPFWGVGATMQISLWSALITGLYLWKKNITLCILVHVLNDLYAFLIVPIILNN